MARRNIEIYLRLFEFKEGTVKDLAIFLDRSLYNGWIYRFKNEMVEKGILEFTGRYGWVGKFDNIPSPIFRVNKKQLKKFIEVEFGFLLNLIKKAVWKGWLSI